MPPLTRDYNHTSIWIWEETQERSPELLCKEQPERLIGVWVCVCLCVLAASFFLKMSRSDRIFNVLGKQSDDWMKIPEKKSSFNVLLQSHERRKNKKNETHSISWDNVQRAAVLLLHEDVWTSQKILRQISKRLFFFSSNFRKYTEYTEKLWHRKKNGSFNLPCLYVFHLKNI